MTSENVDEKVGGEVYLSAHQPVVTISAKSYLLEVSFESSNGKLQNLKNFKITIF